MTGQENYLRSRQREDEVNDSEWQRTAGEAEVSE